MELTHSSQSDLTVMKYKQVITEKRHVIGEQQKALLKVKNTKEETKNSK